MGELALLIYVDTRLFNSLHLFFPVHVCLHLFFFLKSHIPLLKKRLPFSGTSYWKSFFLCSYAKRKSWGESGVFCTQSSSLLAIWFRCTVLSFYSACQIFFQVRFINVLSYICYMPNSVARIVLLGVSIFFMH